MKVTHPDIVTVRGVRWEPHRAPLPRECERLHVDGLQDRQCFRYATWRMVDGFGYLCSTCMEDLSDSP